MATVKHHFLENGDIYAKEIGLDTDEFVVQHRHEYDHFGFLSRGRVVLLVDGRGQVFGPGIIPILRGQEHTIRALEPSDWYCVHYTESKDPAKVDSTIIKKG